jgi:hypothetical protein
MNRIIFILLAFVSMNSSIQAQSSSHVYKVFFNVDESNLDEQDHLVLNQMLSDLKNQTYYEITLTAHTDYNASYHYNEALSKRRAISVQDYLIAKGLKKEFFDIKWQGEMMPAASNLTLEGKAQNRRVEIKVIKKTLNNTQDLIQAIKPQYLQSYNLNQQGTTIISSENGMTITVPENAFTTKDGKTVPQDQVVLKLEEFHNPLDFIFNKLTTISDGKMLESGGMFKITAEFNNQELLLKNDKKLNVEMPSKNIKPNMNVFTGVKNSNGEMEWEIKKETFGLKNNKVKPVECPLVLDDKLLNELYIKTDLTPQALNFKHAIPRRVPKPIMPKTPKYASYPSENDVFTWLERVSLSKNEKSLRMKREMDKVDALNAKKQAKYDRKLKYYQLKLSTYPQDSLNSELAINAFSKWLNTEQESLSNNITIIEQKAYNRAITKLIKYNQAKKLTCQSIPKVINGMSHFNENEVTQIRKNQRLMLALIEISNNDKLFKAYAKNGVIDYSNANLARYINRRYRYIEASSINRLAYQSSNPYLAKIKNMADLQNLKTKGINNKTLAQDAGTIYQASFSNMGYINCDRFTGQQLVDIEIAADKGMQISLYVKSINGMLSASYNAKTQKYIARVPKNVNIQVLVMGVKNGIPVFESQNISFDKTQVVATSPKITTTERILEQLKKVG